MKRCLPIFLLLLSVSAHGALNKWVDAEGRVHYSDQPPPSNVKAQTLTTPSASEPAQKTIAERDAERKKAQKAKEEAAQRAATQQEETLSKQKYCETLRANLSTLESNIPTYIKNAKGESVIMDDATRQQQIETTRTEIGAGCN